jgi:hypothetical protein
VNWFPHDLRGCFDAIAVAAAYDRVYAAGSDIAGKLKEAVNHDVDVLPLGADPSLYRPLRARDQQYRANVVFAGTATPRREALLAQLVEFGLAIWGAGWRKTSLRDYCRGEQVRTEEFVRAYAGATVAVNIHHRLGEDEVEATCNQRLFEIASVGVLQVVDYRLDLDRWFRPTTRCWCSTRRPTSSGPSRTPTGPRRRRADRRRGSRAAVAEHTMPDGRFWRIFSCESSRGSGLSSCQPTSLGSRIASVGHRRTTASSTGDQRYRGVRTTARPSSAIAKVSG